MQALNKRINNQTECCIGDFSVNGFPLCNVLEPPYGYKNDRGKQAIEPDVYDLVPYFSPKFGCVVPLMTVNETTGEDETAHRYEIHYGNSSADTDDCSVLGIAHDNIEDWVSNSRANWQNFMERFFLPATRNQCIKILNGVENLSDMAKWELKILHNLAPSVDEKCTYEIVNSFS
jgi:hypothetical protein